MEMARIVRMILLEHPELSGTLQVSSERINKYDLLMLMRRAYDVDVEIVPDDQVQIDRSLDSTRFRRLTGYVPPSWPQMIEEMAESTMFNNKTLLITGGTGTFGNAVLSGSSRPTSARSGCSAATRRNRRTCGSHTPIPS